MRYPEEHKDKVRARIVETASRVLRRDGLDAVRLPPRHAGCSGAWRRSFIPAANLAR
jgi:hypothetical protein